MSFIHCTENLVPLISEDGSQTFFNQKINESYHSKIGAVTEAEHKFVKPSCLFDLLSNDKEIKILDLFFGLGYNTGVAIDYAYKTISSPKLEILGVEADEGILNLIGDIQIPDWYRKWQELLSSLVKEKEIDYENIKMKLLVNDIFKLIDKLPKNYFDVIFFDPFSHKVTKEFWDDKFLSDIFNLLKKGGTLTTYSGLKRVEKLALDLGFSIKRVEPLGRKKHSLVVVR